MATKNPQNVQSDISEHNVRVEVFADTYGDEGEEEEEDEDDDGDVGDDVPDRDYVKNSSQQMSDKVRSRKKKSRFSTSGEVPSTAPKSAVRGKATRGARPAMA